MTRLDYLFGQKKLGSEQEKSLSGLGWHVWADEDPGLTIIETDTVFEGIEGSGDEKSMNLHLRFNWDEKSLEVALGTNYGDGFEELFTVSNLKGLEMLWFIDWLRKCQNDGANKPFAHNFSDSPHKFNDIVSAAGRLVCYLKDSVNEAGKEV